MTSVTVGLSEEGREGGRPRLGDLRAHLTCVICAGYFIDATTIVECLHTFCRSCILRHLEASSYCPICDVMIHRTKGASSLRADRILQTMVYKLVPGLFTQEMKMRREFYELKPYADPELAGWAKGDVTSYVPHVFTADEQLHLRLALFDADRCDEASPQQRGTAGGSDAVPPVRYLRCQAGTPLSVLQKFIRSKFQLPLNVQVQLIYGQHVLPDDISLMDLGYLYRPVQDSPIRLDYRLVRKRPAVSAPRAAATVIPQPTAVMSEPAAGTSASAAGTSEATEVTSEPPAKRRRTDVEPRQPVVLLERLFDADDEEPTSPKEVEDIIASLDAEEEVKSSRPGTPEQPSASSPSAAPSAAEEEDVPQSSSPRPGPSTECSVGCVADEGAGETGCDDGCAAGISMDCESNPSEDPCAGSGEGCTASSDGCTASGEGCGERDISEGVGVGGETADVFTNSASSDAPAVHSGDPVDVESSSAVVETCAGSHEEEQPSSDIATSTGISTSSDAVVAESKAEQPTGDTPEAVLKQSEPDTESIYDDDATSECGLVVDEDASVASPDPMEADEDVASESVSSFSPTTTHIESDVGFARSAEPATAAGTSTDIPTDSPVAVAVASAEVEAGLTRKSVTPEGGSSCTAGTQTSLCGVSKRSEPPVTSAPRVAISGSSDVPDVRTTSVGSSSVLYKQSEAQKGARSMPSVSCGTQDMKKLSVDLTRKPLTKVDCSVQTVSAETVKRSHKKSTKPVLSEESIEVRKKTSLQIPDTGSTHPEREAGSKDKVKTSIKVSQSLKSSLSKVSHPELASRLVQSVESIGDTRQPTYPDTLKTYAANILRIPNALSSSISSSQGLESKNSSEGSVKTASDKATKHSPDSSSTSYAKSSADIKHFFKEVPRSSSGVAKYLEKNHKRALMGSPLDLSTRANKTAADSTSMVSKRPSSKSQIRKPKPAKAQGTQTIHSIVKNLSRSEHISLTPIPSATSKIRKSVPPPSQNQHQPGLHEAYPAPFPFPAGMSPHDFYSSPLHVNTSMASRLGYDMAMRNLLTLSHMAMAQGGMVRPQHMFPMHPMFPPRPKSHDFQPYPDPSLLRQQSEVRMGAASKKASPTAGTTAPQLRTPTALTSASIQHMEDLTRTVGKRADKDRHSVTVTPIPPK